MLVGSLPMVRLSPSRKKWTRRIGDARERMRLKRDVAHVGNQHLVVTVAVRAQIVGEELKPVGVNRAVEAADEPGAFWRHAFAAQIGGEREIRQPDQHDDVAAVAAAAQRFDEDADLIDAESRRRRPARGGGVVAVMVIIRLPAPGPRLDLPRRNVHKTAMPGAGTDKTKNWIETPAPIVVLVEPQLGENIGAAARVMANFGLSRLRLVAPRQGWPNGKAKIMASGADRVLDQAEAVRDGGRRHRRLHLRAGDHRARPRSGQAGASRPDEAARADGGAGCGRREGRGPVRARTHRSRQRGSRARRRDGDVSGQSGVRLAQSGAGGRADGLRMVQGGRAAVCRSKRRKNPRPRPSSRSRAFLGQSRSRRSTMSIFSARRKSAPPC